MNFTAHPTSRTTTAPGADDPHAMIIAAFSSWGPMWSWEVQYCLEGDPWYLQRFATDVLGVITEHTTDLRDKA